MENKQIEICIICKNENENIKFWLDWHKSIGVNKVYFFDNNDKYDLSQYQIISNYNDPSFIRYVNFRGIKSFPKFKAYQFLGKLIKPSKRYMCYLDVDEFLYTYNKDIHTAISVLQETPIIILNRLFTKLDTDILNADLNIHEMINDNKLFFETQPKALFYKKYLSNIQCIKSFERCNVLHKYMPVLKQSAKAIDSNNNGCNINYTTQEFNTSTLSYDNICILHFPYKTVNKFIEKTKTGFSDVSILRNKSIDIIENKLTRIYDTFGLTDDEFNKINKEFGINIEYEVKNKRKVFTDKTDIDYVFPYVDNTDPVWVEQFKQYYEGDYELDVINGNARSNNYDLLKYKLRTIEKNMPWLNNIYMIVQQESQVPKWLDTSKIKIVYHKDFIPEQFLPTYSSNTIELFLHKIPGLNEKFIYSNDDFYITMPTNPYLFFRNNKPLLVLHKRRMEDFKNKYDMSKISDYTVENCCNLAKKETSFENKRIVIVNPNHHDKPMLKSVNEYIGEKYKDELEQSITKFRDKKNIMQYVYHYWNVFHKNYIKYKLLDSKMHVLRSKEFPKIYEDILNIIKKSHKLLSIDFDKTVDLDYVTGIQKQFEKFYPIKSCFELFTDNNHKTFIPIGGNYLSSIAINQDNIYRTQSCFNGIRLLKGFGGIMALFDNSFKTECLCDTPKYDICECKAGIDNKKFVTENYEIIHLDFRKKSVRDELYNKYLNTINTLHKQKTDKSIYCVYALNKYDTELSVEEIINIKNNLSNFIDTERLIILGSQIIPYTAENIELYKDKDIVDNKFNFVNDNFKTVFGDKYIIINPANVRDLAKEQFYNFTKSL